MGRVAIIGGGFAGLSAGVSLAERGVRVVLLERRRRLGGRAYSFSDSATGDTVDNGQHLVMRCYRHTRRFLASIGAGDRLVFQDRFRIPFRLPEGSAVLALPRLLPPSLGLLVGFLRFAPVAVKDALGLRRVAGALEGPPEPGLTVAAWLDRCGQSERMRRAFWDPLCIATLNQPPASAPAAHLIAVMREAFLGGRDAARLGYPGVGLSALYTDAARAFIEARAGECRLGAAATGIDRTPGGPIRIRLRSGERLDADAAICAVTPPALARLLPGGFDDLRRRLSAFRPSPILSVNLWFDRPVIRQEFLGLLGARMEWIFNKPALYRGRDRASEGHVTLVASAASALVDLPDAGLLSIALEDLNALVPDARGATLLRHRVVREKQATFVLPPGHPHPANRTSAPGLFIAGDWTDTGLPATIESAVLSGYRAADLALEHLKL